MTTRRLNGASVRAIREALGIAHGDLALRLEISAGYLSNLEKGAKQPSPQVLRRIADELGVPVDAISHVMQGAA